VTFDVDENTLQRFQDAERKGIIKTKKPGEFEVEVGLSIHGTNYPLKGIINFANNQFDAKTGTVRAKAAVENPEPKTGKRLLTPGMYARVRVPFGAPVESILVPESAMMSDLGQKYIYVLAAENKAKRIDITPGVTENGLIVVEKSTPPLTVEDRVIVTGVQRVRPGAPVDPKPAK
jgi:multidrug efflux pump subunit AcrA (membrane-fusion protein)